MLRIGIVHRTSWWKCFVDGTNPQDQGRKLVSEFLKSQKIDPYKLDHALINDYKRWLLLEIHDPKGRGGPKAIQLGKDRLANLRRFELMRLRRDFPLLDNTCMPSEIEAPSTFSWSSPASWLTMLQSMFDVTTSEVIERLIITAAPFKLVHSPSDLLVKKPDMYGPFWIATTSIIAMTGAANVERIFVSGNVNTDYSLLWTAAWFVYGSMALVPLAVYAFTLFANNAPTCKINYLHLICVYGYSGLSLIPVVLLCTIPSITLQKLLLAAGAFNSCLFICLNLWRVLESANPTLRQLTVGLAVACQLASYLAFFYIFLLAQ